MANRMHILRFFRDTEARLRELAKGNSGNVGSSLLELADMVTIHATKLKSELIADRLICAPLSQSDLPCTLPFDSGVELPKLNPSRIYSASGD
jgi:hypothetical protein